MHSIAKRLLVPGLVAGAILAATVVPGLADPNLPNIGAHRHFVRTPDGTLLEVGPRLCDNPSLQNAFNQFHVNVHVHEAGTLGPDQSAPGLHNGRGADLIARGCSFVP
jgi:hypothetical protein